MFGGVHKIDLPVLANPDAGLRTFDPPAAYALPRRHTFGHRLRSLPKSAITAYTG